jgi:dihydrolipoamide dehydrogenase
MSARNVDIVVLGGGTGGYAAAIRAAESGKSVIIVERDKLGGTCLHQGCIPSKSLLRSAEMFAAMKDSEAYGITASSVELDYKKVLNRKDKIVEQLHKGVQYLMKANKIEVVKGTGRVIGPSIFSPRSGALAVETEDGDSLNLVSNNLIIATGSRPRQIPGLESDGKYILTSDDALKMEELPASMIIVGGGVIGVEWASMLNDFGVEVTIIEAADRLIPLEDEDISKELRRLFKKRGIQVMTGTKVIPDTLHKQDNGLVIEMEHKDSRTELQADKLLVCVGRQANVDNLGLENTDITVENGVIKVNEYMQTTESHIYAIGDVNGGLQLAHVASHEGIQAVQHCCGLPVQPSLQHLVPRCIYTRPEVASVGWTEQQAQEQGFDVKKVSLSFKAIGKALVYGESDGFVKVLADRETNDILGVHMIGPHVTDYISEAVLAQVLDATPWEVGQAIHPHPTLSEALGEAMQSLDRQTTGN